MSGSFHAIRVTLAGVRCRLVRSRGAPMGAASPAPASAPARHGDGEEVPSSACPSRKPDSTVRLG